MGNDCSIWFNVVVGSNTIVAAGSVVLERSVLEPNSLYAGWYKGD